MMTSANYQLSTLVRTDVDAAIADAVEDNDARTKLCW